MRREKRAGDGVHVKASQEKHGDCRDGCEAEPKFAYLRPRRRSQRPWPSNDRAGAAGKGKKIKVSYISSVFISPFPLLILIAFFHSNLGIPNS